MARTVPIILAVALLAVAAGCSDSSATELRTYNPWNVGELQADLQVAAEKSGDCWTPASSTSRPDAWRCSADSTIHDPCFLKGDRAACIEAPWSDQVVLLRLTEPLADGASNGDTLWALRLKGGEQCLAIGGATTTAAGQRLNYSCENGDVYGSVDRSGQLWMATYQPHGESEQVPRGVEIAWR